MTATTGRIYYVATTGNDANDGTAAYPFRTISKAVSVVMPDDTVIIRAGTYAELVKVQGLNTGVSGHPITIRSENWAPNCAFGGTVDPAAEPRCPPQVPNWAYGGAVDVVIDGTKPNNGHANYAMQMLNQQKYVILRGLRFYNALTNLQVVNSDHITVEDCVSQSAYGTGILLGGASGPTTNVIFRRCVNLDAGDIGISVTNGTNTVPGASDCLFEDCDSARNGWRVTEHAEGFRVAGRSDTPAANKTKRITLRRCIAYDNYSSSFANNDTIDCTWEDCIGWATHTCINGDGRGFIIGLHGTGSGSIVRRCVSFDNPTQGMPISDNPGCVVYDNTVFDNGFQRPGEILPTAMCGLQIGSNDSFYRNNCVFDNSGPGSYDVRRGGQTGVDSDYNLFKDGSEIGLEGGHSISGDPAITNKARANQLANDYAHGLINRANFLSQIADALRPAPGSPLIEAGGFLMHTTAAGSSTTVPVDANPARYFRVGDLIQIDDGDGNPVTMIRANIASLTTNSIILDRTITFAFGAGVHRPYAGNRPDIGAFEAQ